MTAPRGRDEIARTLHELRGVAGLTLAQVASRAGVSIATVSRLESGKYVPTPEQAEVLARSLGAPAGTRRHLVTMSKDLRERTAPRQVILRGGAATAQRKFAQIESASGRVRTYSPVMVVGRLQTTQYARAVFASSMPQGDVEAAVEARMERQTGGDDGPVLTLIMAEAALRWCVDGPDVMADQCDAIAEAARNDDIRVGVIPWWRPVKIFPMHGFDLYDERAVIVGTRTGTAFITTRSDVRAYVEGFVALEDLADFGGAAAGHAERIARDYREIDSRSARPLESG